ncbi:MAG TPA: sialidase family protein [Terriglobia bacterium]|nr:sialidase family protein [Terriglobia bacterium]
MLRKLCSITLILAALSFAGATCLARDAAQTVYQMADGVVRPSRFEGAKRAYLPIIVNSNHASNLLGLPNGDLLCFWFPGTWEGRSGVSIAMSRLDHGSNRWTLPVILSHHPGWSDQNPVPFRAPNGRLWLFHTSQKANEGQTTAMMYYLTSDDQGHSWTTPKVLFPQPGSFDRQHLVVFHNEWLLPTYQSASYGIIANAQNDRSIVKVSKDDGKTWSDCEVPGSGGFVQMDIVKLSEDSLLAFFRSRYADWVYKSHSTDGCHWSVPVATQLPNNNASIQVTRLKDGHLAIAFNNAQATTTRSGPRRAPRTILSVALSMDGGKTWPWVRDVQAGNEPPPFRLGEDPEYAYPSIVQTSDGMIQLAFTFRRETIKYMTFDEQWIKQGSTAGIFKGDPKP